MLVQEGKFDLWLVNFKSWNFFDGSSLGRYIDSKGKARFVGTSGLSQSQTFGCIFRLDMIIDLKRSWRNKLSNHMISPSTCSMPLSRTYPRGFASQLLKSYEQHLGSGEGRRDLRFKPQVNPRLSELQQFKELQLGDAWEDAHMVELLDYLMTSKKVRTASISWDIVWIQIYHAFQYVKEMLTVTLARIPEEWYDVMHTFYDDYRSLVS